MAWVIGTTIYSEVNKGSIVKIVIPKRRMGEFFMFKVIIADDEKIVRIAMRNIINWESHRF